MSTSTTEPYLSLIVPARNDDHGGNMLRRMIVSIDGVLKQLEEYRLESELILVEWNSPAEKPLLKDTIRWPELKYCTLRVIVVPASIHQRYQGADKIPMHAAAAVNCGMRRARGKFIVPHPIDVIYSDKLMAFLATRALKKDERYRVNRYDVDRNVVQLNTLKEQIDYCRNNIIKVNDTPEAQRPESRRRGVPNLHTMASGDFQLMSRESWHLLRGYRETDIPAAYADSLLSYASYAAGLKEVILDHICVYHIDHDVKFNDRISRQNLPLQDWLMIPLMPAWFNRRLIGLYRIVLTAMGYKLKSNDRGVPTLDYSEYLKMRKEMVAGKRSYIINGEDWGLGKDSLEEFIINRAEWDKDYGKN